MWYLKNMNKNDIYTHMVDPTTVTSAKQVVEEVEYLEKLDEFHMAQQLDSPIYKQAVEQNKLLKNQCNKLSTQNELLSKQLEVSIKNETDARREARTTKKISIIAVLISAIGVIISILSFILR